MNQSYDFHPVVDYVLITARPAWSTECILASANIVIIHFISRTSPCSSRYYRNINILFIWIINLQMIQQHCGININMFLSRISNKRLRKENNTLYFCIKRKQNVDLRHQNRRDIRGYFLSTDGDIFVFSVHLFNFTQSLTPSHCRMCGVMPERRHSVFNSVLFKNISVFFFFFFLLGQRTSSWFKPDLLKSFCPDGKEQGQ